MFIFCSTLSHGVFSLFLKRWELLFSLSMPTSACLVTLANAFSHTNCAHITRVFKGSTTTEASHFYLILGVLGLSVYLGLGIFRRVASEITMLVFGFILIGTGLITIATVAREDLTKVQFVSGCTLVLSFGSPIVQTVILSSFSTVLGSQPQGRYLRS